MSREDKIISKGNMKKKYGYIALRLNDGMVDMYVDGIKRAEEQLVLPDGGIGTLFCFRTKKAARDYYGKDVVLQKIEYEEKI